MSSLNKFQELYVLVLPLLVKTQYNVLILQLPDERYKIYMLISHNSVF